MKNVILVVGLLVLGCGTVTNLDREKETLLQTDRDWAAAAAEGKDVERIVSFWADDATVIPAGAPVVRGKAAIRDFVKQSLATPGFHITWRNDEAVLSSDGSMGYLIGQNSMTVPGQDGKLITLAGRGVSIWRRTPGGQ